MKNWIGGSPWLGLTNHLCFRPQKAGRALFNGGSPPVQTPNVIQYYTNPEKFGEISVNSITSSGLPVPHLDGSTNQWHTHSVVTSPDEENCGLSKVLWYNPTPHSFQILNFNENSYSLNSQFLLFQNAQRKIMGGLDAGYGQFPWTAHIKIRGPNIDKVCGGTLVNMRWIVTAGHCTQYCQDVPHCVGEISQAGNYSQPELNTPSDLFIPKTNYKSEVKTSPNQSSLAFDPSVLLYNLSDPASSFITIFHSFLTTNYIHLII